MTEEFDFDDVQPTGSSSSSFRIAAVALGGLVVVSLILLALYYFFLAPGPDDQLNANATQTALAATSVALVQEPTQTARPTFTTIPTQPATSTPLPTLESTLVPTSTLLPSPTPSSLPDTGFADDVGLPGLFLMAASMIVLIVITRRVRMGISD